MSTRETLADACRLLGITSKATPNGVPPESMRMARGATAWRVSLRAPGRGNMFVAYHMGPAHCDPPRTVDVLDCVLLDARAGEQSFEDFCSDFGLDTDSRRAFATWKACKANARKLRAWLSSDTIERLQNAEPL